MSENQDEDNCKDFRLRLDRRLSGAAGRVVLPNLQIRILRVRPENFAGIEQRC